MAPKYCCIRSCLNNTDNDCRLSFFSFPLEPNRCSLWLKTCHRYDLLNKTPEHLHRSYKVCAMHFESYMFAGLSRSRLKKTAVPILYTAEQVISPTPTAVDTVPDASKTIYEQTLAGHSTECLEPMPGHYSKEANELSEKSDIKSEKVFLYWFTSESSSRMKIVSENKAK